MSDSERQWEIHFEEIYRKYFSQLYAYAKVIVNSKSLAKDVVSDVFYNLWKNRTKLVNIDNLEIYLIVAVKNQAIKTISTYGNEISHENLETKLASIEYVNPEELLLEKELILALDKIISNLPDQCQLIFRMAKEQGMKNDEIAQELGISKVTVKSQLRKAQAKLREMIRHYLNDESSSYPDIRLIGQLLILMTLPN